MARPLGCLRVALLAAAGLAASAAAAQHPGEAIFRRGALASGAALESSGVGDTRMQGKDAACINCHRRSGFGAKEGQSVIPPITGRYLFQPRVRSREEADIPFVESMRWDREPYTEATLARAIREGLDSHGKPLSVLMPRFSLEDADMTALTGYLRQLDQRRLPGVTDTVLHFATIITPDADPVKRRGMLDVLEKYFADKNATPLGPTPRLRASRMMMFMVNRRWELHVWQLSGAPSTWQEQLERRLAKEPVLAVISGLAGASWAPVHDFCERKALPCLFPNVEAPPAHADRDFYSLYLSKGVLLEAELIAGAMLDGGAAAPKSVRQIYRRGDSGEPAAHALAAALAQRGITLREPADDAAPADALVLWLRPDEIAALGNAPPASTAVFMSGLLGGLERSPLPPGWRERARLAYPFDLPDKRRMRTSYALGWFNIRQIPLVAEQVQADTFLACGLLAESLSHMADTFVRDYLIERIEDMIGHRILTGYYPRLTLATGQRFASKAGYIARFQDLQGTRLAIDSTLKP
jgi:hypothetical protein